MKILVTGSRHFPDITLVRNTLGWINSWRQPPYTLVHGGAQGVDREAGAHARTLGWEVKPFPADWQRGGAAAGLRRNGEMVAGGADLVLAFLAPCVSPACPERGKHFSHGATDCLRKAEKTGLATLAFGSGLSPLEPAGRLFISKG